MMMTEIRGHPIRAKYCHEAHRSKLCMILSINTLMGTCAMMLVSTSFQESA